MPLIELQGTITVNFEPTRPVSVAAIAAEIESSPFAKWVAKISVDCSEGASVRVAASDRIAPTLAESATSIRAAIVNMGCCSKIKSTFCELKLH